MFISALIRHLLKSLSHDNLLLPQVLEEVFTSKELAKSKGGGFVITKQSPRDGAWEPFPVLHIVGKRKQQRRLVRAQSPAEVTRSYLHCRVESVWMLMAFLDAHELIKVPIVALSPVSLIEDGKTTPYIACWAEIQPFGWRLWLLTEESRYKQMAPIIEKAHLLISEPVDPSIRY